MEILVAIDGGGTRTRCVAFNREGRILGESQSGPSNHLILNRREVRDNLQSGILSLLDHCGALRENVQLVCAGLAGVDYDGEGRIEALSILNRAGFARAVAYGDMLTAHYGALCGEPGVLALAGTGSVFLGRSESGTWVKVGGWGYLLGDEGGAYWIGRTALTCLCHVLDGRTVHSAITRALSDHLNVSSFADLVALMYKSANIAPKVAALSELVDQAADQRDPVAIGILKKAARELAVGAAEAARQADLGTKFRVSYAGSVLTRSKIVRDAFVRALPGAELVEPKYDPIYGAYLLACQELGWEPRLP